MLSKIYNMKKALFAAAGFMVVLANPAQAADCGQPPLDVPAVPTGDREITATEVRQARDAVLAYSSEVDKFINCMERRVVQIAPYMTKEQLTRRQEDIDGLHNQRRDLQIKLNEAIRAYRRQTSNS